MNGDGEGQSTDTTIMPDVAAPRAQLVRLPSPPPGYGQSADSTIMPPAPAPRATLVSQPSPPGAPQAGSDSSGSPLAFSRTQFAQELQNNPDLRRKLMASANAEVGDQSSDAQLA